MNPYVSVLHLTEVSAISVWAIPPAKYKTWSQKEIYNVSQTDYHG